MLNDTPFLTYHSSAKKNDRVQKDGANNVHKVIDKLARYRNGDNIRSMSIIHIDELAKTSEYSDSNQEHTHQWMDEKGWECRTAYAMDKNKKIYEMTLNIANGRDRKILYDINKIKEIDHGVVASGEAASKKTRTSAGLAHKNQPQRGEYHGNAVESSEKNKYSFAGENALIADKSSLENAKSMNAKGVS